MTWARSALASFIMLALRACGPVALLVVLAGCAVQAPAPALVAGPCLPDMARCAYAIMQANGPCCLELAP